MDSFQNEPSISKLYPSSDSEHMSTVMSWAGATARLEKQLKAKAAAKAVATPPPPTGSELPPKAKGPEPPSLSLFFASENKFKPTRQGSPGGGTITKFKAFMLSGEIDMGLDMDQSDQRATPDRIDIEDVKAFYELEDKRRQAFDDDAEVAGSAKATASYENVALVKAIRDVEADVLQIVSDGENRADAWIALIISYLKKKLPPPTDQAKTNLNQYQDDCLYIVCMPEFAFNNYFTSKFEGKDFKRERKANASRPIPMDLEHSIALKLRQALWKSFGHLRVLFAFSCCSYTPELLYPVAKSVPDNRKDKSDKYIVSTLGGATFPDGTYDNGIFGMRKLGAYNRTTIVTSSNAPLHAITKMDESSADAWPVMDSANPYMTALFAVPNQLFHPAKVDNIPESRYNSITVDLNRFFGDTDKSLCFITCLDIEAHVKPGPCNLVVYLGGGLPLNKLQDDKHNFILNDAKCVIFKDDQSTKYKPGYHIIKQEPDTTTLLGQVWEVDQNSVLHRTELQGNVGQPTQLAPYTWVWETVENPLPPKQ